MADFTVTTSFSDSVTGMSLSRSDTFTLTGNDVGHGMADVTSGEYTVTLSAFAVGVGSAGYVFVKNHALSESAEDYVDVGVATTAYFMRLFPGMSGILPIAPATTAIYLIANQGVIPVEIYVREA
ncbi:MAG: hypothetical protein OEN49_06885 [Gammaproteobacteria bacterium]|nr:hypothetical protein [Gammaproteobacteria bacterium]